MNIKQVLDAVPDYKEFMTVNELDESSRRLAETYSHVEHVTVGESREHRPISYLKIGDGPRNALLFAFPHPNEPIGSMTVEFLAGYLAENPELVEELGYTWYLIKAADPDGAALNEGWFKGEFKPTKYARNYYRPPSHEQIEWTFPVEYKNLRFDAPPSETQALMKVIDAVKPDFMFSLHNAGFCGVYYYISHPDEALYTAYTSLVEGEGLPLHRGEPETPYIEKLSPAIFQMFGIQGRYDFYESNGVPDPSALISSGTSSYDYQKRATGGKGFTLVCEMPYFYDESLKDDSETSHERRSLVMDNLRHVEEIHEFLKPRFEAIRGFCDQSSRLYTTVADNVDNFVQRHAPAVQHAETSPMYEGKATVAEAFDNMVAKRFYQTFSVAMTARLAGQAAELNPEKRGVLMATKQELDAWVEENVEGSLAGTSFEVIPIRKLVRVQAGSALLTLQHLKD